MKLSSLSLCGALVLAGVAPAGAAIVTATYSGTITSGNAVSSANNGLGFSPDGDLAGVAFKVAFVFDTTIGETFQSSEFNYALGGTFVGLPSPALSATLTINGESLSFVPELMGNIQGASDPFGSMVRHDAKHLASPGNLSEFANLAFFIFRRNGSLPASITDPFSTLGLGQDQAFGAIQINYREIIGRQLVFVDARVNSPMDFSLSVASGVPEPATWAMMLIGFAGLGWSARRRATARTLPA